jgi:predicted RecA/RadA family phage recombinase
MANNFIQTGDTLTVPAGTDYLSGAVAVEGEIVGIALGDALTGANVDIRTSGVFEVSKVAADEFALGDPVYYDLGAELATSTATDNIKLGVAVAVAAASSASVSVRLSGF